MCVCVCVVIVQGLIWFWLSLERLCFKVALIRPACLFAWIFQRYLQRTAFQISSDLLSGLFVFICVYSCQFFLLFPDRGIRFHIKYKYHICIQTLLSICLLYPIIDFIFNIFVHFFFYDCEFCTPVKVI